MQDNGEVIAHNTPAEEENAESHKSFTLLLMLALEVTAFLTAYVLKKTHFKYLQEAGATMLFGSIVGIFTHFLKTETAARLKYALTFDPTLFFLFLLPPIIYESGYSMKRVTKL